jgi:biotin carboxyl carrier protein
VQAPQAGEIITFNIEDGTAVEYKEVILEISPFFGGHIIGDKKYA